MIPDENPSKTAFCEKQYGFTEKPFMLKSQA